MILRAVLASLALWLVSPLHSQVLITEILPNNNNSILDEDGDHSDWIELFNAGSASINLQGWYLTDSATNLARWRFPTVEIQPGGYLIVWASNKNRAREGAELHTNFRLDPDGEYVGLIRPDGRTIEHHYSPRLPQTPPDIAYGIGSESLSRLLFPANGNLQVKVASAAAFHPAWMNPEIDNTGWQTMQGPVGFESTAASTNQAPAAEAISIGAPLAYWRFREVSGTTATNSGTLGDAANLSLRSGPVLNQASVTNSTGGVAGFETNNAAVGLDGNDDYLLGPSGLLNNRKEFTMAGWVRLHSTPLVRIGLWGQKDVAEFGFVDSRTLQLSTATGGTISTPYPFRTNEWHYLAAVGNGAELMIYADGELLASGGQNTEDYGSSAFTFNVGGLVFDTSANNFRGRLDEIAVYSRALSQDELFLLYKTAVAGAASYSGSLSSDLKAALQGVNSSLLTRTEFQVADVSLIDFLELKVGFDDGFIAYLNGREVARRNAPLEPAWDSTATGVRAGAAGLLLEPLNITKSIGFLQPGTNVLAIHGLNISKDDSDFFISAELTATELRLNTNIARYFTVLTPGKANGLGSTNLGPLILDARHTPHEPTEHQDLVVTARIQKTINDIQGVQMTYRIMFSNEVTTAMFDDGGHGDGLAGDGVYGASISANLYTNAQMIRYFIRASDANNITSRWPMFLPPTNNTPQYLGAMVKDTNAVSELPIIFWFVQNRTSAESETGTRGAVYYDGVFYDNVQFTLHGQSSSGFPKKSYDFDFNSGYHFRYSSNAAPVEDFNLLTTWPDKGRVRNMLAYEMYRDSGAGYHLVFPVRVQLNGAFFSDAHWVEDGDEDYLERIGLSPKGALYKMYNTLDSHLSPGAEKKTRKFEANTDLQALITGLRLTGTNRTRFIYDNVNIPAMVTYLASMIASGGVDCCHKNYYIYRDTEGSGEWWFLPWDVDLTFGRNWTSSLNYFDDTVYYQNGLRIGENNLLPAALFAIPAINQMYLRRIRTLMDDLIQHPSTPTNEFKLEKRIGELLRIMEPTANLDYAKWGSWGVRQTMAQGIAQLVTNYLPRRRGFMFSNLTTIPTKQPNFAMVNLREYEYNPASGNQEQEYIRIENTNSFAVDISDWGLAGGINYKFPAGMVLAARSSAYVSPNVVGFRSRTVGPRGGQSLLVVGGYKGQLSARGDKVFLVDRQGLPVDSFEYPPNPTAAQNALRVTEIMYNPAVPPAGSPYLKEDFEFVVLKNIGTNALDLGGIHFTNGITYTFPRTGGMSLGAGEKIYLVKNREAFISRYGADVRIAGPYLGSLNNGGETVRLDDAVGEKVLDFEYDNAWYPATDGAGYSLQIVNDNNSWDSWSRKESWAASAAVGGSPTSTGYSDWRTRFFTAAEISNQAISGQEADPDQDKMTNFQEYLSGTDPKNASSYLRVQLQRSLTSGFQVQFEAAADKSYSIYVRDTLTEGSWTPWTNITASAQARTVQVQDTSTRVQRYYRLVTPAAGP